RQRGRRDVQAAYCWRALLLTIRTLACSHFLSLTPAVSITDEACRGVQKNRGGIVETKRGRWAAFALLAGSAVLTGQVHAQGWKPERNVEIVIPTSPGGSNDIAGRLIHKLW